MKRDYRLYLDDILEAIGKIEKYTEGLSFEEFRQDGKTVDAVIMNFTVIGEAAKQIPEKIRKHYPDIPWKEMAGMRDKLVHGYFGIRYDVVWETIDVRLPQLKSLIKELLEEFDEAMEKE
jgi:uncharacterized protein with HEPN domain